MGIASVSIDLDSLHHYCRIHGLDESILDDAGRALVYAKGLERFLELTDALKISPTLFAIGEDVREPWGAAPLKAAQNAGAEIGNHSARHPYALTRLSDEERRAEVHDGAEAIATALGKPPVGFRAPGYTMNAALYQTLEALGYAYDSSAFPAAPYYLAKAAVMGVLALRGRPSRAILDRPRVMFAPRFPYRPSSTEPYARGEARVLELPITVMPLVQVPFIGTFVTSLPRAIVGLAYATLRSAPFFNFELHGADFLDASDGIPAPLAQAQRDLRIPVRVKLKRVRRVLEDLVRDFEVLTLAQAAEKLRPAVMAP